MATPIHADLLDWLLSAFPNSNPADRKVTLLPPGVDKKDARNCQISLHKKFQKTYAAMMPNHRVCFEASVEGWRFWIEAIPPSRLQQFYLKQGAPPNDQTII